MSWPNYRWLKLYYQLLMETEIPVPKSSSFQFLRQQKIRKLQRQTFPWNSLFHKPNFLVSVPYFSCIEKKYAAKIQIRGCLQCYFSFNRISLANKNFGVADFRIVNFHTYHSWLTNFLNLASCKNSNIHFFCQIFLFWKIWVWLWLKPFH